MIDITKVKIVPKSYVSDAGVHHCTDVFITYLEGTILKTAYSRLAYPIDPKAVAYEKAAFLRRMNRD